MCKRCKKGSLLGMGILLWAINLFAQGPDTLWTRTYGGDSTDGGSSVQQTSDGGYIIAGSTRSFGAGRSDVYLIKMDTKGETLWTKTYGGRADDLGSSVQQTSDEGYIIAGYTSSFGAGSYDVYLIKTDVNGDTLWTKTYGGDTVDFGRSVQQTSDGGYIIVGYTGQSYWGGDFYDVYLVKTDTWRYVYKEEAKKPDSYDVYLIKTDVNGDTLWTKRYGGRGVSGDYGYSVQQISDGGYIIAGYTESFGAGSYDIYLIKTDAWGDTLWTRTYGGTGSERGYSVQQISDGEYIIAGYTTTSGAGGGDVYLIKISARGYARWAETYGGPDKDVGYSVCQTSDSGYIIAGWTSSFGTGDYDVYLIRTDAKGKARWTKTYGGVNDDYGYSVQQTSDGGYIIAGSTTSFGAGNADVYLIKTVPFLRLTSPNGGEVLVSNTIHRITWIPEGTYLDSYRLLYSLDDGETYPHIIAGRISPNSGLYSWKVPEIDCNTCRVKVQIRDMKGRIIVEDESDSNFTIQSTGIEEKESLPKAFFVSSIELPQGDRTLIKYGLPKDSNVHIAIYNLLGQGIKTLINRKEKAGINMTIWDGRDNFSERVSSGVYFLRFEAGGHSETRKLLLLR